MFQHVWTVNLKFLPEELFQSRGIALGLLAAHLLLLLLFAHFRRGAVTAGTLLMKGLAPLWQRRT